MANKSKFFLAAILVVCTAITAAGCAETPITPGDEQAALTTTAEKNAEGSASTTEQDSMDKTDEEGKTDKSDETPTETTAEQSKADKTDKPKETEKSNIANNENKPKESEKPKQTDRIKSEDYPLSLPVNPIYEKTEFIDLSASGPGVMPYEDEMRYLKDDVVNFVKFEITGVYTYEEAMKISDKEGQGVLVTGIPTLYKAKIIHDYLNQKEVNIEINIFKSGTADYQWEGGPMYQVGEVYISYISGLDKFLDKKTTWTVADGTFNFAPYEIKGKEFAYQIYINSYNIDNLKFVDKNKGDLNIGVLESEKSVVTSTRNNPVKYIQKFLADDLTEFIRNDWHERGFNILDLKKYDGFKLG